MPVCNIAKSEKLFEALDTTTENHGLLWTNVVSFSFDSAKCNGVHNSAQPSPIKTENSFSLGCLCHLGKLCATAALKT